MKDNFEMSGAIKNPFAESISKHGYSTPNGYYSPKDIEEMSCCVESAIPKEIRKRIRKVVSQDVISARAGGIAVGALNRLIGLDGAEPLYAADPEGYTRELECIERLLEELSTQSESVSKNHVADTQPYCNN